MRKSVLVFCGSDREVEKNRFYLEAIQAIDAVPEVIRPRPYDGEVLDMIEDADGILLSGGGDIHPDFFNPGEPLHPSVETPPDILRDQLEISAAKHVINTGKPLFAICRGLQVLNCALGGTLYQDIDDQFPPVGIKKGHRQTDPDVDIPREKHSHSIKLEPWSNMYKFLGKEEVLVNSTHHQALKELGRGLRVSARSDDGVIEAVEMPGIQQIIAVQFHPERMISDYEDMKKLFEYFKEVMK
ncbi:MAG: gamma-glutamyl-gamma-aminobutyrate hydrolase family protein [Firmicutes bacterium]|nr:gamma-glutamyl-gamma-aminobutyrate hydrolase family protein [Bacillota bacterium]